MWGISTIEKIRTFTYYGGPEVQITLATGKNILKITKTIKKAKQLIKKHKF